MRGHQPMAARPAAAPGTSSIQCASLWGEAGLVRLLLLLQPAQTAPEDARRCRHGGARGKAMIWGLQHLRARCEPAELACRHPTSCLPAPCPSRVRRGPAGQPGKCRPQRWRPGGRRAAAPHSHACKHRERASRSANHAGRCRRSPAAACSRCCPARLRTQGSCSAPAHSKARRTRCEACRGAHMGAALRPQPKGTHAALRCAGTAAAVPTRTAGMPLPDTPAHGLDDHDVHPGIPPCHHSCWWPPHGRPRPRPLELDRAARTCALMCPVHTVAVKSPVIHVTRDCSSSALLLDLLSQGLQVRCVDLG